MPFETGTKSNRIVHLGRKAAYCCLGACLVVAGCATGPRTRARDAERLAARAAERENSGRLAVVKRSDVSIVKTAADASKPEAPQKPKRVEPRPDSAPAEGLSPEAAEAQEEARAARNLSALAASPVPASSTIPSPSGSYPIDLTTALRLAEAQNPTIAVARAAIIQALAAQTAARVLLAPSLNAGGNLHIHTGVLQRSAGTIISLTEQSLYLGGGAGVTAAGTVEIPMISINTPLTDAWFEPLAARQQVANRRFHAQATVNDVLLDVAMLHLELLGNKAALAAQRQTETEVFEVVRVTEAFAAAGEGRTSDAQRAQAEWKLRRSGVVKAEEDLAVSAARLSNRLNLDPAVRLEPSGGPLVPIDLIPLDLSPEELLRTALQRRPDLAARRAAVAEADYRHREELARPWLPTLWTGYSAGSFGGGSNILPPLMAHFGPRNDFDVGLFWTFLDFGVGNLARQHHRAAQLGEAQAERARMANLVREQVASARADALAARNQIDVARAELKTAEEGFHQDLALSRDNLVRPIEVLNNLNLLGAARLNLIKALVRYDQAQFRIFVALGSPPPLPNPSAEPVGPPPLNTPLQGPLEVQLHP